MSRIAWNKGIKTGLVPKTAFKKGCKPSAETLAKRKLTRAGYRHSDDTKAKISKAHIGVVVMSGSSHYNWKGGINYRDRHSLCNPEYRSWRTSVLTRDGFKCKMNNKDCSKTLQVHHILRWADYPELRYKINNGITLCQAHHPRKRAEEKRLEPLFRELVSVLN